MISKILRFLLGISLAAGFSSSAFAQATRTWVSGVGDDVNPCSRTAPCKTLAGAISKTAPGGEMNAIDPGGFGAVTITKSLTIDLYSTEGGVLAGGNGVVVNAAATDVVVLRGLDIFGVNPPSNGIRFVAGGALHVQQCRIKRFNAANSSGISFVPSGNSELFVSDTLISENGAAGTGNGILIQPTGAGSAKVALNRVLVNNNNNGIVADLEAANTGQINISMVDCETSGNANHGIAALSVAPLLQMMVDHCTSSHNGADGVLAAHSGNAIIRLSNCNITGNMLGTSAQSGGQILSYNNNRINGNNIDGPDPANILQQ